MQDSVFYDNASEKIIQFINAEWPDFPVNVQNRFLNFFSRLAYYEEEGVKLNPCVLFTNNIDELDRSIPNSYVFQMFEDENENMFLTRIKHLAPFCKSNWNIYVELKDEKIRYGIYKCFNSIKDKDFNTILLEKDSLKEKTDKLYCFLVYSQFASSVTLKGIRENELKVNYGIIPKKVVDFKEEINEFVDASFSKLRTTKKKLKEVKRLYTNIFENVFKNVHGTICVVIDKDYKDDGFFSDGIWLKDPICFNKLFTQSRSFSEAKLLGISNLFVDMLNYDGITIVDNLGRIRAYNVFVEADNQNANIFGGARKRAAFTIINSKVKKIIGVYFQSQEGEVFYQRVR